MADIIQLRRDSAADWTTADPTLASGEIGHETDTGKVKIGDAVTAWTALGYWNTGAAMALDDISDVTIAGPANNEVLAYDAGGDFINQTAAEAGLAVAGHTHVEADIVDLPGHQHAVADINDFDPADYLPLAGGNMSGDLYIDDVSNPTLTLREGGDATNNCYLQNTDDGQSKLVHVRGAGASLLSIDAEAGDNTSDAVIRFCQYANTSGVFAVEVSKGAGSADAQHRLNSLIDGDADLCIGGGAILQGGTNVELVGHTHNEADIMDLGTYVLHSLADDANDFLVASGDDTFVKKSLAETGAILEGDLDHGSIQGLGDDDHSQYILHSLADAAEDFLVAYGDDSFEKKTLAETGAILEADIQHDNLQGVTADEHLNWKNSVGTIHVDNYIEGGAGTDTTAIHDNVASEISALGNVNPTLWDYFLIEDASDGNAKKRVYLESINKFSNNDNYMSIEVSNDSGSEMTKGDLCYISGDSGGVPQVTLADADAEGTGSKMLVLIQETIANAADGTAMLFGVQNGFGGLTPGAIQYVHTTAGELTETAPSVAPDIVRIVGYAISASEIFFNPSSTFVEIA